MALAERISEDILARRRPRKIRGCGSARERSLTPEIKKERSSIKVERVATGSSSLKIMNRKSVVVEDKEQKKLHVETQQRQAAEEVANTKGLVDDGWGGLVEETDTMFLKKAEHESSVTNKNVDISKTKETIGANDAQILDDVVGGKDVYADISVKRGLVDQIVYESSKANTIEDHGSYREQSLSKNRRNPRRSQRDGRRRSRGRIVCLDWLKGRCSYFESCKFLHEEKPEDAHLSNMSNSPEGPPNGRGVCYDWQNGSCTRGNSCRFSHSEQRRRATDKCFDFQKGRCRRGVSCKFVHDVDRKYMCFDFQKGRCFRGEHCRFYHVFDNTEFTHRSRSRSRGVCFDWQRGVCRRGHSCRFDHEDEGSVQGVAYEGIDTGRQPYDYSSGDIDEDYGYNDSSHRIQKSHCSGESENDRKRILRRPSETRVDEYNSNNDNHIN